MGQNVVSDAYRHPIIMSIHIWDVPYAYGPWSIYAYILYCYINNNCSERRQCLIKTNLKTNHTNEKR